MNIKSCGFLTSKYFYWIPGSRANIYLIIDVIDLFYSHFSGHYIHTHTYSIYLYTYSHNVSSTH